MCTGLAVTIFGCLVRNAMQTEKELEAEDTDDQTFEILFLATKSNADFGMIVKKLRSFEGIIIAEDLVRKILCNCEARICTMTPQRVDNSMFEFIGILFLHNLVGIRVVRQIMEDLVGVAGPCHGFWVAPCCVLFLVAGPELDSTTEGCMLTWQFVERIEGIMRSQMVGEAEDVFTTLKALRRERMESLRSNS